MRWILVMLVVGGAAQAQEKKPPHWDALGQKQCRLAIFEATHRMGVKLVSMSAEPEEGLGGQSNNLVVRVEIEFAGERARLGGVCYPSPLSQSARLSPLLLQE